MPFVRFSRDRRGYEHVYLMDIPPRGSGAPPRMLYWFRTPPGVKVGRQPFDPESRRVLQAEYPELTFDWEALAAAQMPPPARDWRERHGTERQTRRTRTGTVMRRAVEDTEPDPGATVENAPAGTGSSEPSGGREREAQPSRRRRRRRRAGGAVPDTVSGGPPAGEGPSVTVASAPEKADRAGPESVQGAGPPAEEEG